jgi:DNA-binding MarR family transcriptional regulator
MPSTSTMTRANDNAAIYVLLDISLDDKEQEVNPSETITYDIIVRNLNTTTDIVYYPPEPAEFNLPSGWLVTFTPSDEISIPRNGFGNLKVDVTAPSNSEANTEITLFIEGSTSNSAAKILPVELTTIVGSIYDIKLTAPSKLILDSPINPVNFEIVITNHGNVNDWVSLELTEVPDGLEMSLEVQEFIILPDSSQKITVTMLPSSILTAGDYSINISLFRVTDLVKTWVSSQDLVVEVVYYPDLYISMGDIELSKYSPSNGENVSINITVHNKGSTDARNITVGIFPVTRSGSQLEDIGAVVIDFIGLDKSTTIQIPWTASPPAVNRMLVIIDPDDNINELDEDNNRAELNFYIIPPESVPSSEKTNSGDFSILHLSAVGIIALIGGAAVTSFLATEYGRFGFTKLGLPFYTRVKREEVLNHEVRELVYDYVKTHPGEHFRSILTKLGLTNGTLVHHLHTLERQNFIKSERDGPFKRFYPTGRQLTEDVLEINGIQRKIIDAVSQNPGMTQKDLAMQLQTSPPTINYHVKALHGVRLLDVKRDGKNTHCFPGTSLNGWFDSGKVS